ncbi:chemotaxis protein CheW [Oligoflexus tunisiensis]|uniref:chemotaxis protein CheW n=1 Tax=Oligoflexus tunisiensis TaxID=708132 RepID=UPI000B0C3F33|nr:chemotaxis protein CheW [Oligoflexus tunisiensis]
MADAFNEFLNFFLDEAMDALNVWEKACLDLERDNSREAREELYRAAHNLKSGSGAVGLAEFNELVHKVEDLISRVLNYQIESSATILKVFLSTHSILTVWIDHLKKGQAWHPVEAIQGIVQSVQDIMGEAASVGAASEIVEAAPDAISMPEDPVPSGAELLLQSLQGPVSEPSPASGTASDAVSTPAAIATPSASPTPAATPKSQESLRVAAVKLDQLIQLVGELSTQQAIVWHGRLNGLLQSKSCDNAVQLIQKIAKDLQGLALSLRLQPLQSLFQRLERTGRDLARSQEKKIEVLIRGDHVEVDRTVIERIADAMTHVIRNAIDHGIETPAERLQNNKKEAATLRIEAVQETSGVMITVSDDGRGLNTERILKKALERGIVRPDADLASQDIHRLIFHAGLSTAEKVTDISGRGVGMDVVKNSVETIGGSIHVSSQPNLGTTFAISLPATLSIIDALIIAIAGSRYAIPVQDVAEIINARQSRIEAISGFGRLLTLRDQLIPVECLREHLPGVPQPPLAEATSMRPALIIRGGTEALAFEVDTILGQQPVTVRRLPTLIANIPGYTGGTILGDGDPCVILNLPALVSRHFDRVNRSRNNPADERSLADPHGHDRLDAIESRFLIFETHGREFAVPLLSVKEIVRDLPCEAMVGGAPHLLGCVNIRGVLLAVYDPGALFELPATAEERTTDIVLDDGNTFFAVRVNRVCAVVNLEAMDKPIIEKHQDIVPRLYGYLGTGMHNGKPIPMLDLLQTVRLWEENLRMQAHPTRSGGNLLEVS